MSARTDPEKKAQTAGHRRRVRERYLESRMESFQDYEMLELLLFYAIPYKDTKPLAKELIAQFGSLHGVFDATPEELMNAGLTENTAVLVTMIPELQKRYEISKNREQTRIHNTSEAGAVCCAMFRNQLDESVRMVCLDASGKILRKLEVSKGDVNAVHFPVRKIVESAVTGKAVSVILAHNHPGGTLSPSREDLQATESVRAALETVGVRLLDHLIVAGNDYCSLREEGCIQS